MKSSEQIDKLLHELMQTPDNKFDAPPLERMNHIREKVIKRKNVPQQSDILTLFASFLNLKIKLYHAVIAFLIVWSCYLLLQNKSPQKQEVNSGSYESGLAAVNNNTVLSSIQTYILRK